MEKTINLKGFNNLDPLEIKKVEQLLLKRLSKIRKDYTSFILELKQHQHAKEFIHEVKAVLFLKKRRVASKTSDKNLYKAIRIVLDKLFVELEHLEKKSKKK